MVSFQYNPLLVKFLAVMSTGRCFRSAIRSRHARRKVVENSTIPNSDKRPLFAPCRATSKLTHTTSSLLSHFLSALSFIFLLSLHPHCHPTLHCFFLLPPLHPYPPPPSHPSTLTPLHPHPLHPHPPSILIPLHPPPLHPPPPPSSPPSTLTPSTLIPSTLTPLHPHSPPPSPPSPLPPSPLPVY